MRLLFAYDHRFIPRESEFYSENQFGAEFWGRFLADFDSITVLGRRGEGGAATTDPMILSSRPEAQFVLLPNLSSARGWLLDRHKASKEIERILARHDAVVARLPSEIGLAALAAAERLGIPAAIEVVGCARDAYGHYGSKLGAIYAPLAFKRMRYAVARATHAIYVTERFLQGRYPAPSAVTENASNVELPPLDHAVLEKRLRRIEAGGDGPLVLGLVGSLRTRTKGIQFVIRALADRMAHLPDCRFHVLGGGDRAAWEAEAAAAGLTGKVFFDGSLAEKQQVFDWLDKVDIYLQPSLQEGLPRALIEAMSRGCPAIASNLAGIPELLDPDDLVPPGDSQELGRQLVERCRDRAWMLERAERNFGVARQYQSSLIDARRCKFWRGFAEYARERVTQEGRGAATAGRGARH